MMNINESIHRLVSVANDIDMVVDTDGWIPINLIDEQSSVFSIMTSRERYTEEDLINIFSYFNLQYDSNEVYHTILSDIELFYDGSNITLFISAPNNIEDLSSIRDTAYQLYMNH
jgi:hypothetical protein